MADISVKREHGMSLEEAQGKVDQIVSDVKSEFSNLVSDIKWNDEKTEADVKGKGFNGNFRVDDTYVGIDISLKLFAKPFKGKVEQKIQKRVDEYFG